MVVKCNTSINTLTWPNLMDAFNTVELICIRLYTVKIGIGTHGFISFKRIYWNCTNIWSIGPTHAWIINGFHITASSYANIELFSCTLVTTGVLCFPGIYIFWNDRVVFKRHIFSQCLHLSNRSHVLARIINPSLSSSPLQTTCEINSFLNLPNIMWKYYSGMSGSWPDQYPAGKLMFDTLSYTLFRIGFLYSKFFPRSIPESPQTLKFSYVFN